MVLAYLVSVPYRYIYSLSRSGQHRTILQANAIKGENFRKIQNELIIFPYITIIERAINRENLRKFQNKFSPLMAFDCSL